MSSLAMTSTKTPNPVAKALEPFVCGGSAATFASIVIHPMDLAKVRAREKNSKINGKENGWMGGWMDGWMDG